VPLPARRRSDSSRGAGGWRRAAAVAVGLAGLSSAPALAGAPGAGSPVGPVIRSELVEIDPPALARERAALPVTIYINPDGGIYTPALTNDPTTNISSVAELTAEIPPWTGSAEEREQLFACVTDLFSPFGATVTDQDPGSAPHIEAVVGGDPTQLGKASFVAGVSPILTNCDVIEDSIVFAFPVVVGPSVRVLCEVVAQEVAHSLGLDHEFLCEDPMTYLTGCGDKEFQFRESVCGEDGPRDCKCSRTQNSARLLLDKLGRGERPSMWLSQPSTGDLLAAGFPVQAVITHPPRALDLYLDGVLIDSVSPADSADPYRFVDFDTNDALRTGTHHVEVVARYRSEERAIAALVEVEETPGQQVVSTGCAAGRPGGSAGPIALVAFALALRSGARRQRRPTTDRARARR
jgi:hypothetical protein